MNVNQNFLVNKKFNKKIDTDNYLKSYQEIPDRCIGFKEQIEICLEIKYFDSKCQDRFLELNECLKNHQSTNQS